MLCNRIDLQPLGGVAGDMFAASMFDAFPQLLDGFNSDLTALNVDGLSAGVEPRLAAGMQAQHFSVRQPQQIKPPRTLAAVERFLEAAGLPVNVKAVALEIYTKLAAAEATVHGKTIDTIHFHEVSDWDSMVDIIAAAGIIARVDCPCWRIGTLPLGGGTIKTAHGFIALPAPATVELLRDYQWYDDGQPGERVTPTGAAIIATLKPQPIGTLTTAASLIAVGTGCGTRELAACANVLRVIAFRCDAADEQVGTTEEIVHIAFEVDDMTGEEIAHAEQLLRAESPVLDVSSHALTGKKGRPAIGLRLLVQPQHSASVIDRCFAVTSTLGVRYQTLQRRVLMRQQGEGSGSSVKIAQRPGGVLTAKAESDDLLSANTLAERRALSAVAEGAALSGVKSDVED